jgi:hypothetical protein
MKPKPKHVTKPDYIRLYDSEGKELDKGSLEIYRCCGNSEPKAKWNVQVVFVPIATKGVHINIKELLKDFSKVNDLSISIR